MSKDIAVVSMLSNNVQCWLQGHLKVQLKSGEEITLNKGVYTDKVLCILNPAPLNIRNLRMA